jgi:biopolymer transport protein ExbD
MEFKRRRRRNGRIDIAPLVDIVFNLLLFFVITYNIAVDSAIRVRLPESSTAESPVRFDQSRSDNASLTGPDFRPVQSRQTRLNRWCS